MPCWYYDKNALRNTPSIQDGIDYETECKYRKEGARFIIDIGKQMDLGYYTVATGVVYFHRFYMFHSFKSFPHYVTACCCLFLAGKVEETPKKCKDIINIAKTLIGTEKFISFGDNPKDEVMTLEKILLQTIKFDLKVRHPYSYLIKYAKCLKGDKNKLQKMVQMAWTFVNDSLCTTLFMQWEPQIIAIATIYLAGKLSKFEVVGWGGRKPYQLRWWDMFVKDLHLDVLEDICHQILDLYTSVSSKKLTSNHQEVPDPPHIQSVESINSNVKFYCPNPIEPTETCLSTSSIRDPRLVNGSYIVNSHVQMSISNITQPITSSSPILQMSNCISPLPKVDNKFISDHKFSQKINIDNENINNPTISNDCNFNNNILKRNTEQENPFNNSINNKEYYNKKEKNPFNDHKSNNWDNEKQTTQFNKILRCNPNFNYNQHKNRFNNSKRTNWDLKEKPRNSFRRITNSHNSNLNFKNKFYSNNF